MGPVFGPVSTFDPGLKNIGQHSNFESKPNQSWVQKNESLFIQKKGQKIDPFLGQKNGSKNLRKSNKKKLKKTTTFVIKLNCKNFLFFFFFNEKKKKVDKKEKTFLFSYFYFIELIYFFIFFLFK